VCVCVCVGFIAQVETNCAQAYNRRVPIRLRENLVERVFLDVLNSRR